MNQGIFRFAVRGVTLIELMISLVIGLVMIAGAATVYLQSRDTYRVNETVARLQETGRYALDVLEPDIRMAGHWGLKGNYAPPPLLADPTTMTTSCGGEPWLVGGFIEGRDAADTGGSGYNLACSAEATPLTSSDVLIVRRAGSQERTLTAGDFQVHSTRLLAIVSRQATVPDQITVEVPPRHETHNLSVNGYYVRNAGNGANGLPQFELRRKTLRGGNAVDEAVIPGVQDLQIQFGVDTNNDNAADLYVDPEDVPAGGRVTSARVWLLVVGEDREPGFVDDREYEYANADHGTFTDGRRRILMSKTIQIRNSRA